VEYLLDIGAVRSATPTASTAPEGSTVTHGLQPPLVDIAARLRQRSSIPTRSCASCWYAPTVTPKSQAPAGGNCGTPARGAWRKPPAELETVASTSADRAGSPCRLSAPPRSRAIPAADEFPLGWLERPVGPALPTHAATGALSRQSRVHVPRMHGPPRPRKGNPLAGPAPAQEYIASQFHSAMCSYPPGHPRPGSTITGDPEPISKWRWLFGGPRTPTFLKPFF